MRTTATHGTAGPGQPRRGQRGRRHGAKLLAALLSALMLSLNPGSIVHAGEVLRDCRIASNPRDARHTTCPSANLEGAILEDANLSNANLSSAELTSAQLGGVIR